MTEKEVAAIFDLLAKLPPLRGDHIMFPTGDPGLDALLPGEVPKGMVAVIKNGVLTYETFESFGDGLARNPCEEVGPPTSYFEKPNRAPSMGFPVDEPRYTGPHLDLTEHSKDLMGVGTPHLCPGCRSQDGEHDFGPTCTLTEEP